MDSRIKEIEKQLDINRDLRDEVECAFRMICMSIEETPNLIRDQINIIVKSCNDIKEIEPLYPSILKKICGVTENYLNGCWEPFSQVINKCHIYCPTSLFAFSSFSELYRESCEKICITDFFSNRNDLSRYCNKLISKPSLSYYISGLITEQISSIFNPLCDYVYSLSNNFYGRAIRSLEGKREELNSFLSEFKETFVSYQPIRESANIKSTHKGCTESQSLETPTETADTANKVAAAGGAIIGALTSSVIGMVTGGIFHTIGCAIRNRRSKKETEGDNKGEACDVGGGIDIENKVEYEKADAAVYAPAEAVRGDDILVQVYIYLPSDLQLVSVLATQIDPDATRRNYTPLSQLLKQGDKIKIAIKSFGGVLLEEPLYTAEWNKTIVKHEFAISIPEDFNKNSLLNSITIFVNEVPVGEMKFKIRIVDSNPRTLWSEVESIKYKKSFISYSHKDVERIRFLAEGFKIQGADCFFDEECLRAGSEYPKEIDQYISSCDVFVLCWSEHAKKSAWVERESKLALQRYDNDNDNGLFKIYPISIVPRADLPPLLSGRFHFGKIE